MDQQAVGRGWKVAPRRLPMRFRLNSKSGFRIGAGLRKVDCVRSSGMLSLVRRSHGFLVKCNRDGISQSNDDVFADLHLVEGFRISDVDHFEYAVGTLNRDGLCPSCWPCKNIRVTGAKVRPGR